MILVNFCIFSEISGKFEALYGLYVRLRIYKLYVQAGLLYRFANTTNHMLERLAC